MKRLAGVIGAVLIAALPGHADLLAEPHLNVVPRTGAEAARVKAATAAPVDFSTAQPFEARAGGAATLMGGAADTFLMPSASMSAARRLDFAVGQAVFEKLWVSSPSSTTASDGLGPLYTARACVACHPGGGRGTAEGFGAVLRLGRVADGAPDPVYGRQVQTRAVPGHVPEGRVVLRHEDEGGLSRPVPVFQGLSAGGLHRDTGTSLRVAPPMIGLGLLEAIPAADILALADPDDADGDGISGRAQVVWSVEHGQEMLGRFGYKAGVATVREQVASAFALDLGLSTPLFPAHWGDCTGGQARCRSGPHGPEGNDEALEVPTALLDLVTFHARNLAVPARRDVAGRLVLRGKELFHDAGCAACHRPAFVTHRLADRPEQSFQLIWPYSDLLLHDMGAGLADGSPEAKASAREWRTAPLWGIGRARAVNGAARYLHDGRARTLTEAILWHGGEALAARDAVRALGPDDHAALIAFLESL